MAVDHFFALPLASQVSFQSGLALLRCPLTCFMPFVPPRPRPSILHELHRLPGGIHGAGLHGRSVDGDRSRGWGGGPASLAKLSPPFARYIRKTNRTKKKHFQKCRRNVAP